MGFVEAAQNHKPVFVKKPLNSRSISFFEASVRHTPVVVAVGPDFVKRLVESYENPKKNRN
jgi:hypothetical protein